MTRTIPQAATTASFLSALRPPQQERLLSWAGVRPGAKNAETARRLDEAFARPDMPDRLLHEVPRESTDLLLRWVLRGPGAEIHHWGSDRRWAIEPLPYDRIGGLARPFVERGWVLETSFGYAILPPLGKALRPAAAEDALSPLRPGSAEARPSLAFGLALTTALFAQEDVALTLAGKLHSRSVGKLERLLGGPTLLGQEFGLGAQRMTLLGVLRQRGTRNHRTLAVDAAALVSVFSSPPLAFAHGCIVAAELVEPLVRVLWQVRRACAAARGPGSATTTGATLDEVAAATSRLPGWSRWDVPRETLDAWDVSQYLGTLQELGLIEAVVDGGPTRVRPSTPGPFGTGRFVVQPSFEVLVPWDAPPLATALLGCVAVIEQADRVCRLRLTRASVTRGVEILGGAARVLTILEEGSGAPLPQNVRATLEGWTGGRRSLLPFRGDVLVAPDDEQRAFVLAASPDAEEIHPGVFLLPEGSLEAVVKKARAKGLPAASLRETGDSGSEDERGAIDIEFAGRRVQGILEALDHAASKPHVDAVRGTAAPLPSRVPRTLRLWPGGPSIKIGVSKDDDADDDEYADSGEGQEDEDAEEALEAVFGRPRTADVEDVRVGTSWVSPLPGVLRQIVLAASERAESIEVLYRNVRGESIERVVTPLDLRGNVGNEFVHVHDEQRGTECDLALVRITAVRRPADR